MFCGVAWIDALVMADVTFVLFHVCWKEDTQAKYQGFGAHSPQWLLRSRFPVHGSRLWGASILGPKVPIYLRCRNEYPVPKKV